jgi:type II secretory pathway component GspD/PulD (secretin)
VLGIALAVLAAAGARAERAVEVYRVQHRTAEELLPFAQAALAGEGSAAADRGTNSLVLIGPRARVTEALALLGGQDRARPTVVLAYESRTAAELEAAGVRVDWTVDAGGVRIGNVRGAGDRVRIGAGALARRTEGGLRGELRVLDGETAHIGTGRAEPVVVRDRFGTGVVSYASAERGFRARPRVLGDGRVRVEIEPENAAVDERGRITATAAATVVEVRSGETVALGGIARRTGERTAGSSGLARERASEEHLLLLTVDVEGGG